jgi:hypothetical protein
LSLKNASSFRRMACGLCLLIGPALLVVASIVEPSSGDGGDTKDYLQALKDDPDMAQLSTALSVWGFALVAIGIVGAVHVIRRRGVVLANLGGALALLGMIFLVALITTTVYDLNQVEHLDLGTADKLNDDLEDYWVGIVILVPALLGTLLGFILLGAAIIRSKVAHIAAGILIIVGIILIPLSEETKALGILANVLLLGGWGLVGLKLLGLTDEQWDGRAPLDSGGPEAPLAAGPPPAV